MGFLDLIILTAKLVVYTALVLVVITFVPGLPPHGEVGVFEQSIEPDLQGVYAPNSILDKAEVFLGDEVIGAESILIDGDTIYFGSADGAIYKHDGKLLKIIQTGKPKYLTFEGKTRGWPLGMRFDKDNNIVVADAFNGILRINPKNGKTETLVKSEEIIEGLPVTFPDDLDISADGIMYWSDASQNGPDNPPLDFLRMNTRGRLIQTDLKTGVNKVLIHDMSFANGVQLSAEQDFVLVCETAEYRLRRYYIRGKKKGTSDLFVENLPGMPDNVRGNGKDGFYISLVVPRTKLDAFGPYPLIRKLIARLYVITTSSISYLEYIFPRNEHLLFVDSFVRNAAYLFGNRDDRVIIVETDGTGTVLRTLQNQKSEIHSISQTTIGEKFVYFGSPSAPKVYRMRRSDMI